MNSLHNRNALPVPRNIKDIYDADCISDYGNEFFEYIDTFDDDEIYYDHRLFATTGHDKVLIISNQKNTLFAAVVHGVEYIEINAENIPKYFVGYLLDFSNAKAKVLAENMYPEIAV